MSDIEQRLREQFAVLSDSLEFAPPDPGRVFDSSLRWWSRIRRHLGAIVSATLALVAGSAGLAIALTVVHHSQSAAAPSTTTAPMPTSTVTAPPTTTTEPPYQVPSDFVPVSFSAISTSHWWVLGSTACGSQSCLLLVTTTDGGRTFRPLTAPETPFDQYPSTGRAVPPIFDVRFADAHDGWLFGPGLLATHDGGHHWRTLSMPGQVDSLEAAAGTAYAMVSPVCPPCEEQTPRAALWRTAVATDAWAPDPAAGGVSFGLTLYGRSVWFMASMPTGAGPALGPQLMGSSDGGGHFTVEPQPIGGISCNYSPVSETVIWEYCSGGHFDFLSRSTDAGAHFTAVSSATPNDPNDPNEAPNGSSMAAASASTVVAARVGAAGVPPVLVRTTDGGATWAQVAGPVDADGLWNLIGFTTPQVGYAWWLGGFTPRAPNQLWRTVDGGATWTKVTALP